jgi:hypothetical protein
MAAEGLPRRARLGGRLGVHERAQWGILEARRVVVVGRAAAPQAGWKSWREAILAMSVGVRPPMLAAAASSRR